MAEAIPSKRYAVVSGANKGIGFEICRQLASKGIIVVLTARDEKKGNEAVEKLKGYGLSDLVVFHQLNVGDKSSIASLADFIKAKFGKLDILVNNAGINGANMDWDAFKSSVAGFNADGVNNAKIVGANTDWDAFKSSIDADYETLASVESKEIVKESYELSKECLQTNYYGTKWMIEALIPLLQLSDSPRIVNVSSLVGQLKYVTSEWAKEVLNDVENLTEERVEEVINKFLKDHKEGSPKTKGWPTVFAAYKVSKASINAYTRIMAKKYPNFLMNCVCPGYVKTDINNNTGIYSVEEGAACPVKLALLPNDGPSGLFFDKNEVSSFE